jgi:hypothetical protein
MDDDGPELEKGSFKMQEFVDARLDPTQPDQKNHEAVDKEVQPTSSYACG